AGSGGTYPVVLLPSFFQKINPFLPFTYAVDLMREAVGGIVWHQVYISVTALAIFGLIFILLAVFLKGPNNRLMNKMLASKDSRYFINKVILPRINVTIIMPNDPLSTIIVIEDFFRFKGGLDET